MRLLRRSDSGAATRAQHGFISATRSCRRRRSDADTVTLVAAVRALAISCLL
jgi:hypothetical protein